MKEKNKKTTKMSLKEKIGLFLSRLQGVKLDEKIFFTKNLAVMIRAGLALSHALKILSQQTKNKKLQSALKKTREEVESGSGLAESLAKHPDIFSDVVINMVRAGESSGQLEKVLNEVADQMKQTRQLTSKLKRALTYPVFIVGIMVIIGIFALTFIMPNMTAIFFEMEVELPLPTKILIAVSDFLINQGLFVLIFVILLVVAFWRLRKTKKGRYSIDSLFLKMPIIGDLIKKISIVKFSRTFSSLLASGIPLVQTFRITSRVIGNAVYQKTILNLSEETIKGINISNVLEKTPDLFPPIVTQMIKVGEKTGTLENILDDIIDFYEDDVDETLTNFTSIIEPFLIVILGIGVGIMALAVLTPMYSLVDAI